MASDFDSLMEEVAAPILFEQLGDDTQVVYRPPGGGTPAYMTAILPGYGTQIEEIEDEREDQRTSRHVIVTADTDGTYGGIATPKLGGTVEIGDGEWEIEAIDSRSPAIVRLTCVFWRKRKLDHYEHR